MNHIDPRKTWLEAVELVKDRFTTPTLYRALEAASGVALDEDVFVVGFETEKYPMSSHLRSSQWLPGIEQVLTSLVGRKVRLQIIEGTDPEDYRKYREMIAANEAKQSSINARREKERAVEQTWDEVADQISKVYTGTPLRNLPQSRAAVLNAGFRIISRAIDEIGYSDDAEEIHKRSFARMIEKFSIMVEMPPQWLAYELFRLREEGKI